LYCKCFFAAIVLFMFNAGSYAINKAPNSPESLIHQLYQQHQPQINKEISFTDEKVLLRYFTPEMAKQFLKEADCREREQGICNIEFDPIFGAQDFDNSPRNLVIKKMDSKDIVRYKVTFTNFVRTTLIYEVRLTENGWRISDIVYADRPSLKAILVREEWGMH